MAVQAQEEVSAALHAMGVDHEVAPASDGGVLKPDLAIKSPSGRIALSVNGASDFCANSPYQPQGDAILGWRLLMLYDWKVCACWINMVDNPCHCVLLDGTMSAWCSHDKPLQRQVAGGSTSKHALHCRL